MFITESHPIPFNATDSVHMKIETSDRALDFWFPKSVFVKNLITGIINGGAYPIVELPGYRPETIIDIGANIGAAAVYFYLHCPEAYIHCYEPSHHNLVYLSKNTERIETIERHPYGLYDKTLTVPLYTGKDTSAQNSVIQSAETTRLHEPVRLVSISEEIEALGIHRISMIKIDTEGCEIPILQGLLPYFNRIDWIYLEYHSETDRLEIDNILSEAFFLLFSKAAKIHRGSNLYVSKRLTRHYPQLQAAALSRPSF